MEKKKLISVFGLSLFVSLLIQVAEPQDTSFKTIGSFILTLWFIIPVFILGVPSLHAKVKQSVGNLVIKLSPTISVLIPYLLLGIFGSSFTEPLAVFTWYLIPNMVLILPYILNEKLSSSSKSILYVVGALLLWIGFDHRHTSDIFDNFSGIGYVMNSLWVAHIGFITYGLARNMKQEEVEADHNLVPTMKANIIVNKITPIASLFIIPIGLLTSFLLWNPIEFDAFNVIIGFIGIFLTIALQEEMIFRGIILHEIDKFGESRGFKILSLVIVSLAFAATHWNNESTEFVAIYILTAFIAGLAYGISYRKGGMFAAMLSHTLINWSWSMLLTRV